MPTSILIIRISSFGDILLTFPMIHLIRNNYPEARIDFMVEQNFAEVFEFIKNYQIRIYPFNKKNGYQEIVKKRELIRENQYDLIIDLQNNFRTYLLTKGIFSKITKFKKYRLRRFLFVKLKLNAFPVKPVAAKYIDSAREKLPLGEMEKCELKIPDELISSLKTNYPFLKNKKQRILIYPGAKHYTKRWPLAYYDQLVDKIALLPNRQIILSGDKQDAEQITKMACTRRENVFNMAGKLTIRETMGLTGLCDVVISNDSAPMHIAALFEKPQISIWGSTVQSFGFAPLNEKSVIIENNDVTCRPCSHIGYQQCPKQHFKCMKDIPVERVYDCLLKIIEFRK